MLVSAVRLRTIFLISTVLTISLVGIDGRGGLGSHLFLSNSATPSGEWRSLAQSKSTQSKPVFVERRRSYGVRPLTQGEEMLNNEHSPHPSFMRNRRPAAYVWGGCRDSRGGAHFAGEPSYGDCLDNARENDVGKVQSRRALGLLIPIQR